MKRYRINEWLDKPVSKRFVIIAYLIVSAMVLSAAALVLAGPFSAEYQVPHPIFVTANDYVVDAKANHRIGFLMNTEPKIEISQVGREIFIRIIDRDGFSFADGSYVTMFAVNIYLTGFPKIAAKETVSSSDSSMVPTEVSFHPIDMDTLWSGKFLVAIYYVEPSGLLRMADAEMKLK